MAQYVIFCHGSSGLSQSSLKWISLFHKLKMNVIVPSHKEFCHLNKKQCDRALCNAPLEYVSDANDILKCRKRYNCIYDTIIRLRHSQIKNTLRMIPRDATIILVGISEGAIAVSMTRDKRIIGKIIASYSCEHNYFTRSLRHILPKRMRHVPTLNIMGVRDRFFSKEPHSVASRTSKSNKSPITGNAKKTFKKRGYTRTQVALLNSDHDIMKCAPLTTSQIVKRWTNTVT